jgi:hypothetical protein
MRRWLGAGRKTKPGAKAPRAGQEADRASNLTLSNFEAAD